MATDEYKFPDEVEQNNPTENSEIEISVKSENDEIDIEIVDDTPEKDRGRKPLDREVSDPSDEELDTYTEGVKKRLKELTHARHDERRAKEAIAREKAEQERLLMAMLEENKRLKKTLHSGSEQYNSMAQTLAEENLKRARKELKDAQEAYDSDAIVAAQESLAKATWDINNLKKYVPPSLQDREEDVQTQTYQPQQAKPDEKTLRWQAKNQWFGADGFEDVTSYALGLHQKLVSSGLDPRSDEYFEQIDARVKSKFPEVFGEEDDKPRSSVTPAKKPAAVVAPASRSTGKRKVELTPTQAALIKKYNLDPQMYVKEVLKLEAQNG